MFMGILYSIITLNQDLQDQQLCTKAEIYRSLREKRAFDLLVIIKFINRYTGQVDNFGQVKENGGDSIEGY